MLNTSQEYKDAINAGTRKVSVKALVYFDPDNPVTFSEDDIKGLYTLEEAKADTSNPLGAVSANEITIEFDNSAKKFTPTNPDSPYYNKLRPNVKIKPSLGLKLPDESYEWIDMGVYWTGDWSASSGSIVASVTCYDLLYALGEMDVPPISVYEDTDIKVLFAALFEGLGLSASDYYIDPSLVQNIPYGYLPAGDKVRPVLQELAEVAICNITTGRDGRILVTNNFNDNQPVAELSDTKQIITAENPQRYLSIYSAVNVKYNIPNIKTKESVLKIESFKIPVGTSTLQGIKFSSGPVAKLSQIQLIGAISSTITDIQYDAWSLTITVKNTGTAADIVTLDVTGNYIETVEASYTLQDNNAVAEFGLKTLEVSSGLIQTLEHARDYANTLLQYITDPAVEFTMSVTGDPSIELGDVLTINDVTDKIIANAVSPYRISYEYDGALSGEIEARRTIAPRVWVYVSPGLWELVTYRV